MRRLLLILIAMLIPCPVFATTTLYVDTDAVSPSPPTYSTLAAAEAALPANLADDYVIECSGSAADTTDVTMQGFDGGGTYTVTVLGDFDPTTWTGYTRSAGIYVRASGVFIDGIRFYNISVNVIMFNDFPSDTLFIRRCVFQDCTTPNYTYAGYLRLENCLIINSGYIKNAGQTINNCTFYSTTEQRAVRDVGEVTNSIAIMASGYDNFYGSNGGDYNLSNDSSAPGVNSIQTTQLATEIFADPANNDFRLVVGADAIGAGTDLSAYFTADITGATRSAPWDIGAFAYAAAATGWAGKIYGITPAKIMGVPVSNISKAGGL